MKIYEDHSKEPYSFLVNDRTLLSDNPLRFRKKLSWKLILVGKWKQSIKKSRSQYKAQYNLDRQAAKISALTSGNISKYEFLTDNGVLLEKGLLEKGAAIKRFEVSPLGKELKAQTSAAEKQYQKLDKVFESNKKKKIIKKVVLRQL